MAKDKEDLTRIFERYRYDSSIVNKSKTWFQQQVALLGKKVISPNAMFKQEKITQNIVPGSLYMFFYDPKYKEQLPYYDRFPLVFPYAKSPDGFIGLNMHYLPTYYRVKLLDKLMTFANNNKLDRTTRIRYSWQIISGMAKFKMAQPCIKQYLNAHVESAFISVHPNDWHTVMMLPVERFVGANKQAVWGENNKWVR